MRRCSLAKALLFLVALGECLCRVVNHNVLPLQPASAPVVGDHALSHAFGIADLFASGPSCIPVRVLHKLFIPAEKWPGRQRTCFLECLSSAPCEDAVWWPICDRNNCSCYCDIRISCSDSIACKSLIPAEKWQAKHTCFSPAFSAMQKCTAHPEASGSPPPQRRKCA